MAIIVGPCAALGNNPLGKDPETQKINPFHVIKRTAHLLDRLTLTLTEEGLHFRRREDHAEPRTCDVLTEDFSVKDILEMILGTDGKRKIRLKNRYTTSYLKAFQAHVTFKILG